MSYAIADFQFSSGRLDSCGYTGSNADRVASAVNQMFAPELAIAQLSTPLSGMLNVDAHGGPSTSVNVADRGGFGIA